MGWHFGAGYPIAGRRYCPVAAQTPNFQLSVRRLRLPPYGKVADMKRQMIAFATAMAVALSGFAAPAEAKSKKNDVIKLLLGAAAVGLILNQMNQGQARAVTPRPDPDDWNNGNPYPAVARTVPAECVMDVTVNGRLREVVSSRCLREFGVASQLPAECAFDIRTTAGTRTVYGPQCLRDYGYRIEQARY